jgi:hypothetical protein
MPIGMDLSVLKIITLRFKRHILNIVIREIGLWVMMLTANFNNISAISWRSLLLVEKTGVRGEKQTTCRKSMTNFISYIAMIRNYKISGYRYSLYG